jgi:transposase
MATIQVLRISDMLWARLSPQLPIHTPKPHPLGCHRRRVPDRQVLDGIFFVLRTGCQWKALSATGICSGSTAYARFQQWGQDGVSARLWDVALQDYEDLMGLDVEWIALDGSRHKAPLGGKQAPIPRPAAKCA